MRKLFIAFLTLTGASALLWSTPAPVRAQGEGEVLMQLPEQRLPISRAAKLRTTQDCPPGTVNCDPDTVWIGHVMNASWAARSTASPFGLLPYPQGGDGPYKVGRGPWRPSPTSAQANVYAAGDGFNGSWDFDHYQATETDSLQGWWPLARPFQSIGGSDFPDYRRAMMGFDYGNQANYVINQPTITSATYGGGARTFGVVGIWHRDRGASAPIDSITGKNVQPMSWTPNGTFPTGTNTAVAWCGIRSSGDLTEKDLATNGGTNQPFSGELAEHQGNNSFSQGTSQSPAATDHNFPGYGSQWDQMLFRDIAVDTGNNLTISFDAQTVMSPGDNNSSNWRIGYFYKDPISNAQNGVGAGATPTSDGNFISSSVAGTNAPRDSFMVYVGAPVNDAACNYSDSPQTGTTRAVFDKKRRWFSEVIRINGNLNDIISGDPAKTPKFKELYSTSGTTGPGNISRSLDSSFVNPILREQGVFSGSGKIRLVFRVKTNRGFDDEDASAGVSGFTSGGKGAAMIDNVVIAGSTAQTWATADGDFEASNAIDNTVTLVGGSLDASGAWHSTGKPPAIYFHIHNVSTLLYADPCGAVTSPNRQCNLTGNVLSPGDHNNNEKTGGVFGSNDQDRQKWIASPTINLLSNGNGQYNSQGIDAEVATVSDFSLAFSLYNAGLKGTSINGNFMSVGYQSYPGKQLNGNLNWAEVNHTLTISFYGATACFETFFTAAKLNGLIKSIRPNNQPDSLRVYVQQLSRCFTTTLTGTQCSPTDQAANTGVYYDNLTLALLDGAAPAPIAISIWDYIQDAFPVNGNSALLTGTGLGGVGIPFDTCGAQVRIGFNIAQGTGTTARFNIPGDTTLITTATSANKRVDMIFRVLPGPGNYVNVGNRTSGVARRPDVSGGTRVKALAGDVDDGALTSVERWWGAYLNNNGQYGSPGGHPGGEWSEHVWNSARCDTVERNIFPAVANSANLPGLLAGSFASMLHEGDAASEDAHKFAQIGISKNRCFLINPAAGQPTNSSNITCTSVPAVYTSGTGYDGVQTTKEYTKILPDGLLTAGSHVEYWFRRSASDTVPSGVSFQALPDTEFVFSFESDGKRWQEFSILPDRWKDGAAFGSGYNHGNAMACMLVWDLNDRRGDELSWVSVADTIGATASARRGAHNGWKARGDQDITVDIATDPSIAVYTHGGQPGTIWDMYQTKAAESQGTGGGGLGARLSTQPPSGSFAFGKGSFSGPTGDMLRQWYKTLLILTGDLTTGIIGPYPDRGEGDVALLQDFATTSAGGTSLPRNVWLEGRGFIESQANFSTGHPTFCPTYFGANFVNGNYRVFSNNTKDIPDLRPQGALNYDNSIYGVNSNCFIQDDVMNVNTAVSGAVIGALYEPVGVTQYIASVYAPAGGVNHPSNTLMDGWRILSLGGRNSLTTPGLINWYAKNVSGLFGGLNCGIILGTPVGVGDNPNGSFINFMSLQSENPMRSGKALISFGITRTEKVELKIYDVTGRLVRTLANRVFKANEAQQVIWDGTNDTGETVASGVYFYQIRTPSFVSQKKLAVLRR